MIAARQSSGSGSSARHDDLAHHRVGDEREQLVLRAHVVVQRHRSRAELGRDAPHRHRVESFGVGDAERDRRDLGAREARPAPAGLDARPHVERVESLGQPVEMLGVVRGLARDLVGLALRLLRDLLGHGVDDELPERFAELGLGGRRRRSADCERTAGGTVLRRPPGISVAMSYSVLLLLSVLMYEQAVHPTN